MWLFAGRSNRYALVWFTDSLVHFLQIAGCLGLWLLLSCTSNLALVVCIVRALIKVLQVFSLLLKNRRYTHFRTILVSLMLIHLVIWIMVMRRMVFVVGNRWRHVAKAYIVRYWCNSICISWLWRILLESTVVVLKHLWSYSIMLLWIIVLLLLLLLILILLLHSVHLLMVKVLYEVDSGQVWVLVKHLLLMMAHDLLHSLWL